MSTNTGKSGNHSHPTPQARLISLLWPERGDIGVIVVFSIIAGFLYLAAPLAVDAVVQNIAFGGEQKVYMQTLAIFSGTLLVLLALMAMVSAAQHYVAELIQQRMFVRLSADMAYRLPRLKLEAIEASKAPELVNRFLDVATLQKSAAMILLDGVNVVLSSLIGLLVLAFYHPSLLVFDIALIVGLLIIIFPLGRNGVSSSIQESYAKHSVAGWFEQIVMFPTLFKGRGGRELALRRTDDLVNGYLTHRKAHYRVLLRQISGLLFLQAIASAALLAVGGALVLGGELTLGQLVASELIVGAIVASIVGLSKHIEIWYDALAATDKLGSLVDLEIEKQVTEVGGETPGALSVVFRDLDLGYSLRDSAAASGLCLNAVPGEKIGFTGPTASGTSAALELAFGLREPLAGSATIGGLDIRQWDLGSLRDDVAYVSDVQLFEGSIAENVRLGDKTISSARIQDALERVGLGAKLNTLSEGLDTPLQVGGLPLSDSQKAKLCMARAIAGRPRLLLVDKLLDGMDSGAVAVIANELFNPDASWTLLIATRNENILERCDRVIRLPDDLNGK